MEVENKQEKTDETTAACASAPAAAKKKNPSRRFCCFSGQRGYGAYRHRDVYAAVKAQPLRAGRGDCFRPLAVFFRDAFGGFDLYFQFFAQQALYFQFQERQGRAAALSALLRSHHSARGSHDSRADKERMAADIGKAAEMVINFVLDYLYCKLIIFKGKKIKEG